MTRSYETPLPGSSRFALTPPILRLAYLAPDITEAILGGWQPRDLDLQKFMADVPIIWADQRVRYRFPPHA